MHLGQFITEEVKKEENSLFCDPSRVVVKRLYPQRQFGSVGLGAHIVKAVSILKSLDLFFFIKYFKYSCFFMSPSNSIEELFKSYD